MTIKKWATRWNEIMRTGKYKRPAYQRPMLSKEQIRWIVYDADSVAYCVLSDASISKTTAKMSEEARESTAAEIARRLKLELEDWSEDA